MIERTPKENKSWDENSFQQTQQISSADTNSNIQSQSPSKVPNNPRKPKSSEIENSEKIFPHVMKKDTAGRGGDFAGKEKKACQVKDLISRHRKHKLHQNVFEVQAAYDKQKQAITDGVEGLVEAISTK